MNNIIYLSMHIIKIDLTKKVPVFTSTLFTFFQSWKKRRLPLQKMSVYLFSVLILTESS